MTTSNNLDQSSLFPENKMEKNGCPENYETGEQNIFHSSITW